VQLLRERERDRERDREHAVEAERSVITGKMRRLAAVL